MAVEGGFEVTGSSLSFGLKAPFLGLCLGALCATAPAGAQDSVSAACAGGCGEKAREVYASCLENGGEEEACKRLGLCDKVSDRCEVKCAQSSRRVLKACVDAGGSERECRARAEEHLSVCLGAC